MLKSSAYKSKSPWCFNGVAHWVSFWSSDQTFVSLNSRETLRLLSHSVMFFFSGCNPVGSNYKAGGMQPLKKVLPPAFLLSQQIASQVKLLKIKSWTFQKSAKWHQGIFNLPTNQVAVQGASKKKQHGEQCWCNKNSWRIKLKLACRHGRTCAMYIIWPIVCGNLTINTHMWFFPQLLEAHDCIECLSML